MRTSLRGVAALLLLVLLICSAGVSAASATTSDTLSVTYTFSGTYAKTAGFAEGTITITPGTGTSSGGYYLVYYADDTDTLKNYDAIAYTAITGGTRAITVKSGLMLPVEATQIAVFESETFFVDDTPPLSKAVAVAPIPAEKRITLGTPELKFASVSDVHMDYETLSPSYGSYTKWANALDFFTEQGMEYIIVSGDMTGDSSLDSQYQNYLRIIEESDFPLENIYECIGNHGNTPSTIGLLAKYTSGPGENHPYENSPYYSVLIEGKNGARDNLFIFMAQDLLKASGGSASYDNFSKAQIDWLEALLEEYGDTETNLFLVEHSPFLSYGPGDRHGGAYTTMVTFNPSFPQTMRLKGLIEKYKNIVMMSGHTHLSLYDGENYSDEKGTSCRMVHNGSVAQPCSYGTNDTYTRAWDGRYSAQTSEYGSEGYLVSVYSDYIVYTGYNLATGKIIPAGCIIMPVTVPENDPTMPSNLARGRKAEVKANKTAGYNGDLTDGIATDLFKYDNGLWFAFSTGNNFEANGRDGLVTIDLGAAAALNQVRIHTMFSTGADGVKGGAMHAEKIKLEVSSDGKAWTEVEQKTFEKLSAGTVEYGWVEFQLNDVEARHVRLTFTRFSDKNFVVLDEIEVWGVYTGAPPEPNPGTGGITGDIDGNGKIEAMDYIFLKRAILGTYVLTDKARAVADINGDGSVDSFDYMCLKRAILGTYRIPG